MPFAAQDGSVTSNPKWENLQLWICAKITDSELDVSGNLVDKYFVPEIAKPISSDIELSISYVMNLLSKSFCGCCKTWGNSSYHSEFFNACTEQTDSVLVCSHLAEVWVGVLDFGQSRNRKGSLSQWAEVHGAGVCCTPADAIRLCKNIFHSPGKPDWGAAAQQIHEVPRQILSNGAVWLFVGVALIKFALLP